MTEELYSIPSIQTSTNSNLLLLLHHTETYATLVKNKELSIIAPFL